MSRGVVRAAGAVLWRHEAPPNTAGAQAVDGRRVLAVIHRPRYDDWSLPKGKLDAGEDDHEAALREITEETGQRAEILRDLGEVRYRARKRGAWFDKVVRFFEMRVVEPGRFVADDEVDEIRWLPIEEALELLTYKREAEVVRRYDSGL